MRERRPMTQTIKASDVRAQWSEIINQVFRKEARIVVEKSGIPVAAIVSVEDLERFTRLETQREELLRGLEAMSEPFKDIPEEEIEREVAQALAVVRAEKAQSSVQQS